VRWRPGLLANREELIQQAASAFRRACPGVHVGIERADERADGAKVAVASVQSIYRQPRLGQIASGNFRLVICDEAHHSPAQSYRKVFTELGAFEADWPGLLLGLTATSRRGDGVALGGIFEEVVYSRNVLEMVDAGYLVPLRGYLVRTGTSLGRVRIRMGDFDERQLARAVNTAERNAMVASSYLALGQGRKAIVYGVDVAHTVEMAEVLRRHGVRAAAVYGTMKPDERARVIGAFRDGDVQAVTNCQLLVEGFDDPASSCIVMARPTCSGLLYTQIVGRGVRTAPGKQDCQVIDIVDNSRRYAHQIVTLPTLFGLPPEFDLKGQPAHRVVHDYDKAAAVFSEVGIPEDVASRLLSPEDIKRVMVEVDLLRLANVPPVVADASPFVWQRMPDGRYVARVTPDSALWVRENAVGRWDVHLAIGDQPSRKYGECFALPDAMRLATRVIYDNFSSAVPLLSKSARWRTEAATEKQLALLRRMGVAAWPGITRGQASLLIDRRRVSAG
jgi:hypothetical protein